MPPKDPKTLREQIEQANEQPASDGYEYSAEGLKVRTPSEDELLGNLAKVAKAPTDPADKQTR